MQEKIKTNRLLLTSLFSIVAIAMTVAQVLDLFNDNLSSDNIISLISALSTVVAGLILLGFTCLKKELSLKELFIPIALYFLCVSISNVNSLYRFNDWTYTYYLALYGALVLTYFLYVFTGVKCLRYAVYVLMIISMLFAFSGTLGGNSNSLGRFVLQVVFLGNLYLLDNKEEENV